MLLKNTDQKLFHSFTRPLSSFIICYYIIIKLKSTRFE